MEAAIRGGEFKRVGSVAIARHGKPVYEAYFDGDAATLCDTRSATKSLASALTGLAIFLLQPVGYPADGCRVPDIHRRPLGESLVEFPPRSAPIGR